jgi:hypothetical protein
LLTQLGGAATALVSSVTDPQLRWSGHSAIQRLPASHSQKILETKANGNGQASLSPALLRLPAKRSLVFLLSDFQEDFGEIEKALKPVAHRHDVVSIVLWDPREKMFPTKRTITVLKDLETGMMRAVWLGGTKRKASFQERVEAREQALKELFQNLCMDALWIHQETNYVQEISQLFMARRRQTR